MLDRLANLDRRVIYLLVALAVIIPLVFPLNLPVVVSQPVRAVYDFIDRLPPGSLVWMGFDFYQSTRAETGPAAIAVARHLFRRGDRVVATALVPDGALISQNILDTLAREEHKTYGVDYVTLGYKAGNQIVMKQICDNLHGVYPTDMHGRSLDSMPITRDFRNYHDIKLAFTTSDTALFDYYAIVVNTQYHVPVAGACTAVMVPTEYPYVNAGQILGIIGGLKGAAEYEKLTGVPGLATSGMDAQSVLHLLVVCMIVFSNAVYFLQKRRR